MKFHFKKIILWLNNGKKREITFEPNKVNVITGDSNTGKSAILQIIDYCLFASRSKISESMINENVIWYGINILINDKNYTICRKSLNKGKVSTDYYFSSSGEIPDLPEINNDGNTIKLLLETEFGIDHNVTMPFGGKALKSGSRISLRYFLLFTTISEDIITNSTVYFDKQTESRYREALLRIFDFAVGIDSLDNILEKEKKVELKSRIKTLEQKINKIQNKTTDFQEELNEISKNAKEFGLIESDTKAENIVSSLKIIIENPELLESSSNQYSELQREEYSHNRIIRNLKNLKSDYSTYKITLKNVEDSILPISFLHNKKDEVIKTSIFEELILSLEDDLLLLRADIKDRTPIDTNISDLIYEHEKQLIRIREQLSTVPQKVASFNNEKEKYIFIGEIKEKLKLYTGQSQSDDSEMQLSLNKLINELESLDVRDVTKNKEMFIKLLEEIIQEYICFSGNALENYAKYLPFFDYEKKQLLLRKPKTAYIENVGSSSNHMFLHVFLFLGIHEVIHRENSSFVPSYLIIDQPSRPYWGDGKNRKENIEHGDEAKIRKVFELLNDFVNRITNELKKDCQLIVFEHVPPSTWEGLEYIHLVEEFTNGNALVPT